MINFANTSSEQNISSSLGDLRTNNIFLNDIGKVRIANLLSWPNEQRAW